jgi:hypothetical protein
LRSYSNATHTEVRREFQVGVTVADDRTRRQVHRAVAHELLDQACFRLTAGAVVGLEVRAHKDLIEFDALGAKGLHNEFVGFVEGGLRQGSRSQAILVGDHHEPIAAALQVIQSGEYTRQEPDLLQAVDLLVGRLFHERSVPINE